MLRFALPFLPGGLCVFVLNYGDRVFLKTYGGQEALGTYALGYKVALVAGLLSRAPFGMVWGARMYHIAKQPDADLLFGKAFTRLVAIYVFVGLGISLLQDEVVALLGGTRYADATIIIAPVMLAYCFQMAADLMEGGLYVCRRTIHKTWIALCSATVMLALYALLIPTWKSLGAALATLGGFVFHMALTFVVSQRVFRVSYERARVAAMLLLAILLWLMSRLAPGSSVGVFLKLLLWAAWPMTLWATGLVSADEKAHVRSLGCALMIYLRALVGQRLYQKV
jgi:O-antigen/teichoic acid export membrane protein